LALSGTVGAQYYSNGQESFSIRWLEYSTDRYRLIYPERNGIDARRVSEVLDVSYDALHYGFSRRAARLPILLHTQNLHSNGMVVWTPRRSELITTPPTETFAVPWLKQLTVHEYRHVVQMSNLDRGVTRWMYYLLGEQALGASAAFLSKWYLEGDAVLAETALSTYGRALQPEFTLAYRALLANADVDRFPLDKWFCGSYRDVLPNHYYYGYQMVNAGYKRYGVDMWEQVYEYIARRPYLIVPRPIAFRKYYGTSSGKLFRETFGELKTRWDALPPIEETMRIVHTPTDSYTTYSHPQFVNGRIVAHKADLSRSGRLVVVDPRTGVERVLAWTGPLSSRPAEVNGQLFWTEYRPSTFREQKNHSVVRRMPVDGSAQAKTLRFPGDLFYVTPYGNGFAAVEYDPEKKYSVVFFDADFRYVKQIPIPAELTVHGLAWDEKSGVLAAIVLGEKGMNLEQILPEQNTLRPITRPSFVTINHLTAGGGKLFYNSTASGRDESHGYDLAERKEYRLSASQFGSVMPSIDASSNILVQASYRGEGYLLSTQNLSETLPEEIPATTRPVNLFNPTVFDAGLLILDTMNLYPSADACERPSRRYRRAAHLFKLHSWAPVGLDVFEAAGERNLDLGLGATVMTQNELGDTEGYLSYGRIDGRNWWRGALRLMALAPKFEISAEYDGGARGVVRPSAETPLPQGWNDPYFSMRGEASLPFNLSSGSQLRSLTPSLTLKHYNTLLYRPAKKDFSNGYQQGEVSLAYAQNAQMALRDLAPRWGFGLQATWATAPFDRAFSSLWSFYGNAYLPGVAVNHSLRLRGAYQTQTSASYHFSSSMLFPRGVLYNFAPNELGAILADYRFPVAYPDGGIDEVIYIKRLSANAFGGYARYSPIVQQNPGWRTAWSYGLELSVDFNLLRMVGTGFTFRMAFYRTNRDPLAANAGFAISL
jgi:hypothetical protein